MVDRFRDKIYFKRAKIRLLDASFIQSHTREGDKYLTKFIKRLQQHVRDDKSTSALLGSRYQLDVSSGGSKEQSHVESHKKPQSLPRSTSGNVRMSFGVKPDSSGGKPDYNDSTKQLLDLLNSGKGLAGGKRTLSQAVRADLAEFESVDSLNELGERTDLSIKKRKEQNSLTDDRSTDFEALLSVLACLALRLPFAPPALLALPAAAPAPSGAFCAFFRGRPRFRRFNGAAAAFAALVLDVVPAVDGTDKSKTTGSNLAALAPFVAAPCAEASFLVLRLRRLRWDGTLAPASLALSTLADFSPRAAPFFLAAFFLTLLAAGAAFCSDEVLVLALALCASAGSSSDAGLIRISRGDRNAGKRILSPTNGLKPMRPRGS